MSNAKVAQELQRLRADVTDGRVTMDEAYETFQQLTFTLADLAPGDEARLQGWVNDLELIRFGQLPEHQLGAVGEVLEQAQVLFDELVKRSS